MKRRKFMKGSVALGASLIATDILAGAEKNKVNKEITNLIFINLKGGPSQLELFDGKPGSYSAGPTKSIKTKIKNVYFNRTMKAMAGISEHMIVCRMSSPEKSHNRGQYYLQSGGNRPLSTFKHPGLCSLVGWAKAADLKIPGSIAIGSSQGSGYLGQKHAPFVIENLVKTRRLLYQASEGSDRLGRVGDVRKQFLQGSPYKDYSALDNGSSTIDRALRLSQNQAFMNAIGVLPPEDEYCPNMESVPVVEQLSEPFGYNDNNGESFIASCSTAVKLMDIGVPAVQVELSGWDTHSDNFKTHESLTSILDGGVMQLVNDLKEKGKFENTLIYISGEFGRTPKINKQDGREDYADIFCSALISGSITSGKSFGETSRDGKKINDAVSVAQLTGSILKSMGIDPLQKIYQGSALVPLKRELLPLNIGKG